MNHQHIVVMDAEQHARLSLSTILKQAGFHVTAVADEVSAQALCKAANDGDPVDLLVVDSRYTDTSSPIEQQTPKVVICGSNSETAHSGTDCIVLREPFEAEELLTSVAVALKDELLRQDAREEIQRIIAREKGKPGSISRTLEAVQRQFGHISPASLRVVAEATGRSLVDLYGFVTTHEAFRVVPNMAPVFTPPVCPEQDVRCAHCNHTLLDPDYRIDGQQTVCIDVSFGEHYGSLWVATYPGYVVIESERALPLSGQVDFFCPQCSAQIMEADTCIRCGAPMIPVPSGRLYIPTCSRVSCSGSIVKEARAQ